MKKWIPDYANRSSTNLIPNKETSVTMTDTGFICVSLIRYNNGQCAEVAINGEIILRGTAATSGYGQVSAVLPVVVGDVVTLTYNTDTPHYMYFIPGRWV